VLLLVLLQADAASGRDKASCEAKAAKAKAALDVAVGKVVAIEQAPLPKIEVRAGPAAAWVTCTWVRVWHMAGSADWATHHIQT
jgi:hypothetical protein